MALFVRLGFNAIFPLIIITVNILQGDCLSKNRDDWVDPHDMRYYDRATKSMIPKENIVGSYDSKYSRLQISAEPMDESSNFQYTSDSSIKEVNPKFQCQERVLGNQCTHFLQRFINVFLRGIGLEKYKLNAGSSKQVTLELLLTAQELASLQQFGLQGDLSLVELDLILTNILTPNAGFTFGAFVSPVHSMADYILERPKLTILLSIATVLLFCIYLIERGRFTSAIFILFIVIFTSGFGFNWWRMYQEAIVDQMVTVMNHSELPLACRPKDWGWMSAMYYWFKGDIDCRQYFKSVKVDPFVKISPTLVMSETITMIFTHPLQKFGHAFGAAFNAFLSQLPLGSANPLNYILLVFLVIVIAISIVCYLAILSGQRLRFSSFFSSIEMSPFAVQYGNGINIPSHIEDAPRQRGLSQSARFKDLIANQLRDATTALQQLAAGSASGQDESADTVGSVALQQADQVNRMDHPSFQNLSDIENLEGGFQDGRGDCSFECEEPMSPAATARKSYFPSYKETKGNYGPQSCCDEEVLDNKIEYVTKAVDTQPNVRLRKTLRLTSAVDSGEQTVKKLADGRVVSHRKLSI